MQQLNVYVKRRVAVARGLARWRHEAGHVEKLVACGAFALLIALSAQIRIVLPFTPVPFTGEVLTVLLAGFFLGKHAPLSVGMYLALGAAFGWFSGLVGFAAFSSIAAGYLLGFVVAAAIVGWLTSTRSSGTQILLAMCLGSSMILLCGAAWLCLAFSMPLIEAIMIGVLPFVAVDAVKIAMAATIARGLSAGPA
ncbi:MAG: biotin transporter BioY [Methanomassiliicoccales archaeon]|jgi:biotin transport system substrate-specific component